MNIDWMQMIPLLMVLFIGIPHGAADSLVALKTYQLNSYSRFFSFITAYVTLVALVILAWVYYPILSLMGFLFISAFHFGLGDTALTLPNLDQNHRVEKGLISWCQGGSIVFLMPLIHIDEVLPYFKVLTQNETYVAQGVLYCGLVYWCIGLCVLIGKCLTHPQEAHKVLYRKTLMEIGVCSLLYTILPPLWSFALYFCFIHTFRHFKRLFQLLGLYNVTRQDWIHFWIISGIAITFILGASFLYSDLLYSNALLKSLFIGLSALTVPHVILIDGLQSLKLPLKETPSFQ